MAKGWQDEAVCGMITALSEDYEHWYRPEDTHEAADAASLCFSCPVRDACLEAATAGKEPEGIWGGQPASVRRKKKHDLVTLSLMPNPYTTDNPKAPHHIDKLHTYVPGEDDEDE